MLVATPGFKSGRTLIVDAMLIALAANLGNLLDRAPGRTIKFGLVAYVPIAIVIGTAPIGIAIAPVIGASVGLLGDDLRERLMLGDTGANVIGAVLGLAVVLGSRDSIRLVVMLVLLGLNVAAELVSFSRVIDAVPPLRAFDQLGRRRSRTRSGRAVGADIEGDLRAELLGPVALGRESLRQSLEPEEVVARRRDEAAHVARGGRRGQRPFGDLTQVDALERRVDERARGAVASPPHEARVVADHRARRRGARGCGGPAPPRCRCSRPARESFGCSRPRTAP